MDVHQLFSICNFIVMPCWLALLFIPENKWVKNIITAVAIFIAIVYVSQLPVFFQMEEGGFGSLTDVMLLFKNEKCCKSSDGDFSFNSLLNSYQRSNNIPS